MDKKKKFDLILPESMTLPDGVELPNIETETATIRKTIIGKDGEVVEVEQTIEVPVIPND